MNTKIRLVALLFVTALFISTGVNAQWIKSSGKIIKETRNVDSFTSIKSAGSADIIITQESVTKVVVESDVNLVPHVTTEVRNGVLVIEIKKNYRNINVVKVHISIADLESIKSSGSGDIILVNKFKTKELQIKTSGSGDFVGDLDVKKLEYTVSGSGDGDFSGINGELKISIAGSGDVNANNLRLTDCSVKVNGSGDISLKGSAENIVIGVSGSGDIDAYGLKAVNVTAKIAGSGEINITAIESIVASIAGSGDIYYKGNPSTVKVSSTGSGDIYKR